MSKRAGGTAGQDASIAAGPHLSSRMRRTVPLPGAAACAHVSTVTAPDRSSSASARVRSTRWAAAARTTSGSLRQGARRELS